MRKILCRYGCVFASVESRGTLVGEGKPVIVGGGKPSWGGVDLFIRGEAFGVRSAMPTAKSETLPTNHPHA